MKKLLLVFLACTLAMIGRAGIFVGPVTGNSGGGSGGGSGTNVSLLTSNGISAMNTAWTNNSGLAGLLSVVMTNGVGGTAGPISYGFLTNLTSGFKVQFISYLGGLLVTNSMTNSLQGFIPVNAGDVVILTNVTGRLLLDNSWVTYFSGGGGGGSGGISLTDLQNGLATNVPALSTSTISAWQDPKIGTKDFRLNVHQAVERDFIIGDSYAGSCLDFFSTPYAQLTNLWATYGCAGSMGQSWNFSAGIIATALNRPESKSNWFAFAASAPTIYASDGSNDVIEANLFQGCVPVRFTATHGGLCWKVFPQGGNTHVAIVFDNGYITNFTISSQSAGATTNTAFTNWNLAGINSVSTTTNVTFQIGQMDGTNTFLGAGFYSTNGPGIIACWASAGGTTLNTMLSCDTNALNVYGQWALGSATPTNAIGNYDALDGSEVTDENDLTNKLQLVLQNLMHGAPVFIDGPPPANQQLAFPADYELLANRGYQRYCAAFPNSFYVDLYDALPNFTNNLNRGMMNGVHPSIEGAIERAQFKNALMGLPQLPTATYGTFTAKSNIVASSFQGNVQTSQLSLSNSAFNGSTFATNLDVTTSTNAINGIMGAAFQLGDDPTISGTISNVFYTGAASATSSAYGMNVFLAGGIGKGLGQVGMAGIATPQVTGTANRRQAQTLRLVIGGTNNLGTYAAFTNLAQVQSYAPIVTSANYSTNSITLPVNSTWTNTTGFRGEVAVNVEGTNISGTIELLLTNLTSGDFDFYFNGGAAEHSAQKLRINITTNECLMLTNNGTTGSIGAYGATAAKFTQ